MCVLPIVRRRKYEPDPHISSYKYIYICINLYNGRESEDLILKIKCRVSLKFHVQTKKHQIWVNPLTTHWV